MAVSLRALYLLLWLESVGGALLLGNPDLVHHLHRRLGRPRLALLLAGLHLVHYLPLALLTHCCAWADLLLALAFLLLPTALTVISGPRGLAALNLWDLLALLSLWSAWRFQLWPPLSYPGWSQLIYRPVYLFTPLTPLLTGFLFGPVRDTGDWPYDWRLPARDWLWAGAAAPVTAALAWGLGLAVGVARLRLTHPSLQSLLAWSVYGFLFFALTQELLFRLLQELLDRLGLPPLLSAVVTAPLFGLGLWGAEGTGAGPLALAAPMTVLGLGCAMVYWRTRRIPPTVLISTLVFVLWQVAL